MTITTTKYLNERYIYWIYMYLIYNVLRDKRLEDRRQKIKEQIEAKQNKETNKSNLIINFNLTK